MTTMVVSEVRADACARACLAAGLLWVNRGLIDIEAPPPLRRDVLDINVGDPGRAGTTPTPLDHRLDCLRLTLEPRRDRAVKLVARPPGHPAGLRLPLAVRPEVHALDVPVHPHLPRDHRPMVPPGTGHAAQRPRG